MSREVRKVPHDWQHPRDERGRYIPMFDEDFESACRAWKEGYERWKVTARKEDGEFWEYDHPPDRERYRPVWSDEERTHYQMYETTSEGTPISPPMESPEVLARWLADTRASAFAGQPASYEHWLRVCQGGYAPSAVGISGRLMSGVEGISVLEDQPS